MCFTYGMPSITPLSWWLIHAAIITVATLCSEFVCMKLETQEIKLSVNDILDSGKQQAKILVRQVVSGS
jgi:hypothetical protein